MRTVYCLFFIVCFTVPASAYIDPGTGSMLFSLLTGLAVTAFFFVKNLIITLKSSFFSKGTVVVHTKKEHIVIYSEGKQYWNVFKPIVEALDRRGIDAALYTSDTDDPALSFQSPHIRPQFIGSGNAGYRQLNFLEAGICLMTTPGLDVFQLKRSPGVEHYAHILHAVTDATFYRLFGIDYFDSVLLTGDYQKKDIRILEQKRSLPEKQLVTVGCTYLDALSEHMKSADPVSRYPADRGDLTR
ncbi:MAG: CDP-glycerol--glycerophosphate glycerophosphotransferase, partial [Treponema sp.]|nr:CDP-glycerol--glycerophosphate glycerophosphotransferase [Treponema sp.]